MKSRLHYASSERVVTWLRQYFIKVKIPVYVYIFILYELLFFLWYIAVDECNCHLVFQTIYTIWLWIIPIAAILYHVQLIVFYIHISLLSLHFNFIYLVFCNSHAVTNIYFFFLKKKSSKVSFRCAFRQRTNIET